jgi:type I restriction enzyme S subunit
MIEGLKPYPRMKDSGVAWLGDVPEHWEVLPNRALFAEINERDHPDEQMLSVTITQGVITQKALLGDSSKKDGSNENKAAYKLVQPNEVVYNKMRAWQGAIGVSAYRGIVSPAYVVQRARQKVDPRYFHHVFRTPAFAKEAERWSYGITSDMWSLRPEHFRIIYSGLPPLPEQEAIVRFLDHADRRIRRYIRAKQKLIKLLEEQKQAIIHRAVTRGLDSSVRLKPTSWLGSLPANWDVVQLRRLVQRGKRITYGIVQPGEPDPSGRFMVRGQDYSFGWAQSETIFRVSDAIEAPYKRSRLQPGDIVLTIVGAGVGNVAIVPAWLDGANITQTTARISADVTKANAEFLSAVLSCPLGRHNVELYVKGAAQPGLNLEHVRVFLVPVPPLEAQSAIVDFIRRHAVPLEFAVDRVRREITLIEEYRTRLISDSVTGKVDLREVAAQLPNLVEDTETEEPNESVERPNAEDEDFVAAVQEFEN